jgi:hypothetical protein
MPLFLRKRSGTLTLQRFARLGTPGQKWMKEDNDYLKPFATKKEKQKERHKFHRETVKRVAAYISHMMTRWEDMDVIFAPYHIQ